jgi:DNA repair photolyase
LERCSIKKDCIFRHIKNVEIIPKRANGKFQLMSPSRKYIARGSHVQPKNRFESVEQVVDWEQWDEAEPIESGRVPTQYLPDQAKSIISENDSPDIPFRYSLNAYRGCAHGCAYCYARPSHEYLGMSAGLDFEAKILVKHEAAKLFRAFLCRPQWQPELIAISGVTDPYQPAEREFKLTRACLQVALEARQPLGVITKNALIARDLDILRAMARLRLVHANVSLTSLQPELTRELEPRTSVPAARLRVIEALANVGVPVRVMIAPIIPGLNDAELPAILQAARSAGAQAAGYIMLRLPGAVKPVFMEWLERSRTLQAAKVEGLIRSVRAGELSDTTFGQRMRGTGEIATQISQMFHVFRKRYGFLEDLPPLDFTQFQPPRDPTGQLRLF